MSVRVRGLELQVDIMEELSPYEWSRPRTVGEKFLACSPFRFERNPSFAIRLDDGRWIDSGSDDEDWKKGGLVKLLSFLRNETSYETEEYLLEKYHIDFGGDDVELRMELKLEGERPKPLDMSLLDQFAFRHPYLEKERGIEERFQYGFRIGYDKKSNSITFPWLDKNGQLVNVKFRSVKGKRFFYLPEGQPIKNHLYGLNHVRRKGAKKIFVVEAEIDCITLWQAGFPAVALGGANMTRKQRDLILQSGIEELVIATDNDKAGHEIARSIFERLGGYIMIQRISFPNNVKDVNEMTTSQLLSAVGQSYQINLFTTVLG